MDGQLSFGFAQDLAQTRRETEVLSSKIELLLGDVPCVDRGCDLLGRHWPDTLHGRDHRSERPA